VLSRAARKDQVLLHPQPIKIVPTSLYAESDVPMPTFRFSAESPSQKVRGGWTYAVHCEYCKANLGRAMEGFGPEVIGGLSADEVASRLLKQALPAKDVANLVRHHDGRCWVVA
jgi:hypothetical protein